MYYRGAAAALVVYDITNYDSFSGAKTWIEELQRQGSSDIIIGLAGNKSDLENKREVPTDEARNYAVTNKCIFYEMSAKSGENVNVIFQQIANKLPKNLNAPNPTNNNNNADLLSSQQNNKSGNDCCR